MANKQKNIPFAYGIHRTPTIGKDGELSECVNLIPKGGELVNIQPLVDTGISAPSTYRLLYVHHTKTAGYKNYIFYKFESGQSGTNLVIGLVTEHGGDTGSLSEIYTIYGCDNVIEATSMGNTLIILTSVGNYFFIWVSTGYKTLGDRLPGYNVRPFLYTTVMDNSGFANSSELGVNLNGDSSLFITGDDDGLLNQNVMINMYNGTAASEIALSGDIRDNVSDKLWSVLNTYGNRISEKGYFHQPFFVRFAYRLYDGTFAMQSAPMLMLPNTIGQPLVTVNINSEGVATLNPLFTKSQLHAKLNLPADLEDWSDIITSFCVFVSPPIIDYTVDDSRSITSIRKMAQTGEGANRHFVPDAKYMTSSMTGTSSGTSIPEGPKLDIIADGKVSDSGTVTYLTSVHTDDPIATHYQDKISGGITEQGRLFQWNEIIIAVNVSSAKKDGTRLTDAGELNAENAYRVTRDASTYEGFLPSGFAQSGDTIEYFKPRGKNIAFWFSNYPYSYTVTASICYLLGPVEQRNDYYIPLKRTDNRNFLDCIKEESNFYLVKEYDFATDFSILSSGGTSASPYNGVKEIDIDEGVLNTVQARTRLNDTSQGRTKVIASSSIVYNNRLNVVVESESLPSSDPLESYCVIDGNTGLIYDAWIHVNKNGGTYCKRIGVGSGACSMSGILWFAYPDADAYALTLKVTDTQATHQSYQTIPLSRHSMLNAAYGFCALKPINNIAGTSATRPTPTETGDMVTYRNKIYQTFAMQPFVFNDALISDMTGDILKITTAVNTISEGQFGQFPLYAFCSDGLWALQVKSDGTYSAPQPLSHDVCNNAKAVTQIDGAVIFTTAQGLKKVYGNTVELISDKINGHNVSEDEVISKVWDSGSIQSMLNAAGYPDFLFQSDDEDFRSMTEDINCIMYDYPNRMLRIMFSGAYKQLVYSLESNEFASFVATDDSQRVEPTSIVNGYPYSFVQYGDTIFTTGVVISENALRQGWVLTRKISMSSPLVKSNIMDMKLIDYRSNYASISMWKYSNGDDVVLSPLRGVHSVGTAIYDIDGIVIGYVSSSGTNSDSSGHVRSIWISIDGSSTKYTLSATSTTSDREMVQVRNRVILLGSNSGSDNWYPVSSLKSHSFQYYRFLVATNMFDHDALNGISVIYQDRWTDKIR